ncbi:MAG: succinate dehydrogenase assembly factor 2 [Gammaproteobacteria bacterium]|nr:succinate dehydrogenase assembly factor 2 [Gammaproteobacteria bacterium]NBT44281.1 succinate dehydrogenase assembly factor 2 [Gammaproteobacteria bacterium]NBY21748.1 succinate dehydrogenase assembly factor 2 [Gammaproteobacteria bacterium]NDE35360.1 succinate dehydrogenase assembly factor 2 [Gammaproteobacteria bacterium]NDE57341.1 succinate dehydrogenase assembly factor 2 [Gammaproteobacteria bacterium]
MNEKSLRWRCRRGMRELDTLLLRYLEEAYDKAVAAEKKAFEDLLDWPDEDLWRGLILGLSTDKIVPQGLLTALRHGHSFNPP